MPVKGQWQNSHERDIHLREVLTGKVDRSSKPNPLPFETQVWLTDMSARLSSYINDPAYRLQLLRLIHEEATRLALKPELVLAVIETESSFNRFAVSKSGAQGLMQVMPFWKEVIGRTSDNLIRVQTNIRYGCTILSYYLKKENGNLTRALARYNGSLGKTWYADRVINNWHKNWLTQ